MDPDFYSQYDMNDIIQSLYDAGFTEKEVFQYVMDFLAQVYIYSQSAAPK